MGAGATYEFCTSGGRRWLDCEETATTRRERGWHEALVGVGSLEPIKDAPLLN
jgi:hypothetical protein